MFVRFLVGVLAISAQRGRYHRFNTGTIVIMTLLRRAHTFHVSRQDVVTSSSSSMHTIMRGASLPSKLVRCSSKSLRRTPPTCRALHQITRTEQPTALCPRLRPHITPSNTQFISLNRLLIGGIRSIFIQTENTPNADVSNHLWCNRWTSY